MDEHHGKVKGKKKGRRKKKNTPFTEWTKGMQRQRGGKENDATQGGERRKCTGRVKLIVEVGAREVWSMEIGENRTDGCAVNVPGE